MFVIYGKIEIFIPGAVSKKDKRSVVQGIINRLKTRFSVSVVELEYQDSWQRSVIGIAAVCRTIAETELIRQAVLDTFDSYDHSCSITTERFEVEKID